MDSKRAIRQLNALAKQGKTMRLAAESWESDFQILISTIMSARTRDEVTIPTAERLFSKYPDAKSLSKANINAVKKLIRPANFYNNKSKNIINCAKVLVSDYNGKVPRDINELLKLPGVGRKTANVFLVEHGHDALPVDTHVFYLSKKLKWAKDKNPHKVEKELKTLFPTKYWNKINVTLVRFGKTHTSRKQKDALLTKIRRIR